MDTVIHKTAQEEAYFYLRESILSGRLSGGVRLDISRIADHLGMSRMPVREALRQLASEGLVAIRPNRGVVVTQLTPEDVLEIFEMRAALEGLAARLARPHMDEAAFLDLEHILRRMERVRDDPTQWIRFHNEFHDAICRRSGRMRLAQQTLLMRRSVEAYYRVFIGAYRGVEVPGSEHARLLEQLEAGDPQSAERAMRDHIALAAGEIVAFLRASRPPADRATAPPGPRPHRKTDGEPVQPDAPQGTDGA